MEEKNNYLKPEDYLEPDCLLCDTPDGIGEKVQPIPQQRILEKVDSLMGQKDFDGTQRLLKYWLDEAIRGNDTRGKFMIFNEMMGFYRQTSREKEALRAVDDAMALIPALGYEETISGATCYVNAATVYCAFDQPQKGISLFEKALAIYKEKLCEDDYRLGGLYNNMALTLTALGRYKEAIESYFKAIEVMEKIPDCQLEQAISYLNIIDCLDCMLDSGEAFINEAMHQIDDHLHKARELLDSENLARDYHYGYVVEKCIDVYDHFGWSEYADELRSRVKEIYERA
ncbi:MAG: tetratricopeptide repeat protein [Erysipelotrichaceae bacterium]|nr:tetratricopeptide repeat protein [Erysipelotrichaceae bacterium]